MKNTETGRSMVEMLGVLAIIGVLSVAGIAGYSMAMRKVKANDIMAYASQCGILARSYNAGTGITTATACNTLGADTLSDAGITALSAATGVTNAGNTSAEVVLTFNASNKALCEDVKTGTAGTGTCAGNNTDNVKVTFTD